MTRSTLIRAVVVLAAAVAGGNALATEPVTKITSANTVSAQQFSREMAAQLTSPRSGALVDPLSPAQRQQMQQSLETYFHNLIAEMLGGQGGDTGKKGICLTQQLALCNPGDVGVPENVGACVGKPQASCTGKAGTKYCQDSKTLKKYTVDLKCRWVVQP